MKFSLFAHLERTDSTTPHTALYADFLRLARIADDGGMHAIWTGEHHGMDFTITPNPFITLAALAHHTRRVRLGTGTIIAPFWHPIKLAGEAAMADIVCEGRLELGIARGAYSYEYERLLPGLDAWSAGARMREIVPTLRKLWTGDYAHEGEFFQFPATTATPKPLQDGGPPIWVAARDPSSHDFAVRENCHVQVTPLWLGYDEIATLMQRFCDARAKHPPAKGSSPRKIMLLHHTYVAADAAEADWAAERLSRFFCYFGAWFKNERAVSQGMLAPLTAAECAAQTMYTPAAMREQLTIGTAAKVADKIKRYEDLGYDEFSYWLDSGMSFEEKRVSLSRFIDEVMLKFS